MCMCVYISIYMYMYIHNYYIYIYIYISKAMVFPKIMYRYKSWTIKKAEHQIIDHFELWCWRRVLRVICIARRSDQSILKEINPEYSLEGLMLKLQNFGHLMQRANWLEKTLMLGKTEGKSRRGRQRMRWVDDIINFEQTLGDGEGQGNLVCYSPGDCKESDMTEQLNWTQRHKCLERKHSVTSLVEMTDSWEFLLSKIARDSSG